MAAAILLVDPVASERVRMRRPLRESYSVVDAGTKADAEESIMHDRIDLLLIRADTPARQQLLRSLLFVMGRLGRRVLTVAYFVRPLLRGEERTTLELGANLVCCQPLADFRLFLRQLDGLWEATERGVAGVVRVGPLEIDVSRQIVRIHGAEVDIKKDDCELLGCLAVRAGTTVLMDVLERSTGRTERGIRARMDRMCARFEAIDNAVRTVYGAGYRMEGPISEVLAPGPAKVIQLNRGKGAGPVKASPRLAGEREDWAQAAVDAWPLRVATATEDARPGAVTESHRYDWSPSEDGHFVFDKCSGKVTLVSREGSRVLQPPACELDDRVSQTVIKADDDLDLR